MTLASIPAVKESWAVSLLPPTVRTLAFVRVSLLVSTRRPCPPAPLPRRVGTPVSVAQFLPTDSVEPQWTDEVTAP